MTSLIEFATELPKVELHVHFEGSIRPESVLKLALKNNESLPVTTLDETREWFKYRDFAHFIEVYVAISKCIKTPDDLEYLTREFLDGQAAQNIFHSEVTYSATTIEKFSGIPWADQHAALLRGMRYGKEELDISMSLIIDIVRGALPDRSMEVAQWAVESEGVVALGIAGDEGRGTAQYASAFQFAHERGFPVVAHAGETQGPDSIREVLAIAKPVRIGHGVRCVEDARLVRTLERQQIPLEVCPSSNLALGVYPDLEAHPLPKLLDEGMYVTINSDDPSLFGSSLSEEFAKCMEAYDLNEDIAWTLCRNAARASLLSSDEKGDLLDRMRDAFPSE